LSWVVDGWHSKQLALALDASTLGQRFTVLAVSVLYRGCAVPVAWKILKSTEPHAWEPEWKILLGHFRQRVPADWTVIVLADRGLYAKCLAFYASGHARTTAGNPRELGLTHKTH
jgi:hypothetical protein